MSVHDLEEAAMCAHTPAGYWLKVSKGVDGEPFVIPYTPTSRVEYGAVYNGYWVGTRQSLSMSGIHLATAEAWKRYESARQDPGVQGEPKVDRPTYAGAELVRLDREVDRIMSMSDEELRRECEAGGETLEEVAAEGRAVIGRALREYERRTGKSLPDAHPTEEREAEGTGVQGEPRYVHVVSRIATGVSIFADPADAERLRAHAGGAVWRLRVWDSVEECLEAAGETLDDHVQGQPDLLADWVERHARGGE